MDVMRKPLMPILIVLLSGLGCSSRDVSYRAPTPHGGKVAAHAAVDAIYEEFSRAYDLLDSSMVANLYTRDALYLQPSSDLIEGRMAIKENFASFFESVRDRGGSLSIRFELVEREIRDEIVWDVGYYLLRSYDSDGEIRSDSKGKFNVIATVGEDGRWYFRLDSFSGVN